MSCASALLAPGASKSPQNQKLRFTWSARAADPRSLPAVASPVEASPAQTTARPATAPLQRFIGQPPRPPAAPAARPLTWFCLLEPGHRTRAPSAKRARPQRTSSAPFLGGRRRAAARLTVGSGAPTLGEMQPVFRTVEQ